MKILFLDHDGVLSTSTEFGSRFTKRNENSVNLKSANYQDLPIDLRFDDFNTDCIKVLNEIIEETNCEIVITSTWSNYATLQELRKLYSDRGVIKEPMALINKFDDIAWPGSPRKHFVDLINEKAFEIHDYVMSNDRIKSWCVLSRLDMWDSEVLNFFQTDETMGLAEPNLKDIILYFLNEEDSHLDWKDL